MVEDVTVDSAHNPSVIKIHLRSSKTDQYGMVEECMSTWDVQDQSCVWCRLIGKRANQLIGEYYLTMGNFLYRVCQTQVMNAERSSIIKEKCNQLQKCIDRGNKNKVKKEIVMVDKVN